MENLRQLFILDPSYEQEYNNDESFPERCLLVAILQRAIADLQDNNNRLREDAIYWFTSADHIERWGTYNYICSYLEMDPVALREAIFKICRKNKSNGEISSKARKLSRRSA